MKALRLSLALVSLCFLTAVAEIILTSCGGAVNTAHAQSGSSSLSVVVGATTTLPPGSKATVTDSGTPSAAVLNFGIPQGIAGTNGLNSTVQVGSVNLLPFNSPPTVTNSGTVNNAVLNFGIPQGQPGNGAATLAVGKTTTLPAGSQAAVTNSGTPSSAVLNFAIPQGQNGINGINGMNGQAATVQVGAVTSLPANSKPTVVNVGSESAAVLNFGIPSPGTAPLFAAVGQVNAFDNSSSGLGWAYVLPQPLQVTCPTSTCNLDVRLTVMAAVLSPWTVGSFDLAMNSPATSSGPVPFQMTSGTVCGGSGEAGVACGPLYVPFSWDWVVTGVMGTMSVNVALSCQDLEGTGCEAAIGGVGTNWASIGSMRVDVFPQ